MGAQVEAELRELDPVEAAEYLQSLGASEGGLASLIRSAYRQLGLLTYFTTGQPQVLDIHPKRSAAGRTPRRTASTCSKAERVIQDACAGVQETRAWTVRDGMTAPEAAGVIHSDFERGFIKAETVAYDDLVTAGSLNQAKDNGRLRLEGKEYVVSEGDVMNFKFNV